MSYRFTVCLQEEQVARVRQGMSERVQQLESQIQGKLEQARERRETIEREQKEKLRNHVSFVESSVAPLFRSHVVAWTVYRSSTSKVVTRLPIFEWEGDKTFNIIFFYIKFVLFNEYLYKYYNKV